MRSVMVLGKKIKIIYVKELKDENGNELCGRYSPKDGTIEIRKDMPTQERDETIMHEMIHACIDRMGMHQQPGWNIFYEELICEQLSRFLCESFNFDFD